MKEDAHMSLTITSGDYVNYIETAAKKLDAVLADGVAELTGETLRQLERARAEMRPVER